MAGAAFDADAFDRALAKAKTARSVVRVSPERWACREAAAVRSDFLDFAELHPRVRDADAEALLRDDCRLVVGIDSEPRWRLDESVRGATLRRLGKDQAILRLIALNRAPGDTLQRLLEAIARHDEVDLGALSFAELVDVHQLTEWLDGVVEGAPARAAIEHHLEVEDLLSPLRGLVAEGFHGRSEALERLWRHLRRTPESRSGPQWLTDHLRQKPDRPQVPLMIEGIGGAGKSTLIARFLLDVRAAPKPLPFAYIDFDRPGLRPKEPLTLLAEIARQVGILVPELTTATEYLRRSALELVAQRGSLSGVVSAAERDELLARFGRVVTGTIDDTRPLVLVLDTLEEVQYRGEDFITQLWQFLDALGQAIGGLCVITAGRIRLQGVSVITLPLDDLEPDSAREYVSERLDHLDVDPDPVVDWIVSRVGCNPLSLRLAVDVVKEIGAEGLNDALREARTADEIDAELVQGVLYHRILQHVHDEELEKLALPGLAMREITAEVIRDVLAEPCGLDVVDENHAMELIEGFAREVALIEQDRDGTLRYRSDVRRLALRLVPKDPKIPLREIEDRAVAFYEQRDDDEAARAEALYHRLRRGDDRDLVEPLWDPALVHRLADALEDLEGNSYAWLATKLGVPLAPEHIATADQPEWEAYAAKRARDQLDIGDPEAALAVLRERKQRQPASRLPLLEAEALGRLGRHKEALKVLDTALAAESATAHRGLVVEINLASARTMRRLQELQPAVQRLQAAAEAAAALSDPFVELGILLTAEELKLPSTVAGLQIDNVLARVGMPALASRSQLLAAVVGAFGEQRPHLLREALLTLGLPLARRRDIERLADALAVATAESASRWEPEVRAAAANPAVAYDLFASRLEAPVCSVLAGVYRDWSAGERPSPPAEIVSSAAELPARAELGPAIGHGRMLRAERRLGYALRSATLAGTVLAAGAFVTLLGASPQEDALAALSVAFGLLIATLAAVAADDVQRYGWTAWVLAFGLLGATVALAVYATPWASLGIVLPIALVATRSAAFRARHGLRYLNPVAFRTLVALAEVLTGSHDDTVPPEDVAANVDRYLAAAAGRAGSSVRNVEQRSVRKGPAAGLLRNAVTALGLAPLTRLRPPLSAMAPAARLRWLQRHFVDEPGAWPIQTPLRRSIRETIRASSQLVYLGYYGDSRSWSAIGYDPFSRRPGGQLPGPDDFHGRALRSLPGPPEEHVRYDAVVVGSGAGGAIAAYRLAETGRRVLVVERGPHVDPREFGEDEASQYLKLYDEGGLRKITDMRLQILTGACVGGSTVVGNAVCMMPPDEVLERWARRGIDPAQLRAAIGEVRRWLPVGPADEAVAAKSGNAFAWAAGRQPIAGRVESTQSSLASCLGCGLCNLGCGFGRKLSMLDTILPWAQRDFPGRLDVLPHFDVKRIVHAGGRATAVTGTRFGEELMIHGDEVVIAAGAVASSRLLQRSGIGDKRPGAELYFQLSASLVAEFPTAMRSFAGLQTSHTFVPDSNGGPAPFLLQTFFHQPLAQALSMPGWFGQHYENMRRYAHMAGGNVLLGTTTPGRVTAGLTGGAYVSWSQSAQDHMRVVEGLGVLGRILLAAGALRVMPPTHTWREYSSPAALASMVDDLRDPRELLLTTGVPQGGNPVGDPELGGVVDADFRVHGFTNLFVCDASVFPTAVGVPPLLTVMGMAQYAARRITGMVVR